MDRLLARLNPEQRAAARHGLDGAEGGPLLIVAGAGTGKTNTLAHRVACLVASGVDPRTILLLTFSRRAAVEMTRRVEGIVAGLGDHWARVAHSVLPWAGTFHGIGARLLREYAERCGMDPAFTILDREDAADLMNLVRAELRLNESGERFPLKGTCLAIYSTAVNKQSSLDRVLAEDFPWCAAWEPELRRLFAAYVEAKQRQGVLDYDDLLLYWAQLMTEPALASDLRQRFTHVLVDEYQDTNRLQATLLLALKPDGRGLTAVGDDAQAIYAFRGATVRNILEFPALFSPAARLVTLARNYRSTQSILDATNAVIGLASERFTKDLWSERSSEELPRLVSVADETEQARYVADMVLERREASIALKSQAVLVRASSHSALLELELVRRNIPYVKFGGLKFLEAAHVKDVLAFLRVLQNPRDRVAGFRVLQLLPGVGPKTAARLLDAMANADRRDVLGTMVAPSGNADEWEAFAASFSLLRDRSPGWPAELELVSRWYEPHLQRRHDNADVRLGDLRQLEAIAAGYPSRERFLTELTLDPPGATSDEAGAPLRDEDYLILSTIHSAKGQEWKAVYLLNAVDGCIPSDLSTGTTAELEEERRLLYVAMTRAKDHLTVVVPQRFYVHQQGSGGDRHVYASRSRFIPDALAPRFHRTSWPAATVEPDHAARPVPAVDLAARMRGMWS
ncbi:MAG TPA: ATP-dependent helicase [Burkholderiaceae bacterium]|nr:ATP-dependent helicase [Burkholderiaceae bacterium]